MKTSVVFTKKDVFKILEAYVLEKFPGSRVEGCQAFVVMDPDKAPYDFLDEVPRTLGTIRVDLERE